MRHYHQNVNTKTLSKTEVSRCIGDCRELHVCKHSPEDALERHAQNPNAGKMHRRHGFEHSKLALMASMLRPILSSQGMMAGTFAQPSGGRRSSPRGL